jgi:5-methylcytosine-specific restriction enzyme subunit McrC
MWEAGGTVFAVVDAKYKAEKPEGFPNADLYQLLSYCTVLGLDEGHLIYAKGNEPVDRHTVQGSGVVIHCHALDLSAAPAKMLRQVDYLARLVSLAIAA